MRRARQIVVIPVGKASPFGHPTREVLERWKNCGRANSTRQASAEQFPISTDGRDLQVKTFHREYDLKEQKPEDFKYKPSSVPQSLNDIVLQESEDKSQMIFVQALKVWKIKPAKNGQLRLI